MNTDFEAIEIHAIQNALITQVEDLEDLLSDKSLSVFERESYQTALDASRSALEKIEYMISEVEQ